MIEPINEKVQNQLLSGRKNKNIKSIDYKLKSKTINKDSQELFFSQSSVPGMKFCLFKREVYDEEVLKTFMTSHWLDFDNHNVSEIKEFAESSFESPIDFKPVIKKLQKRIKKLK